MATITHNSFTFGKLGGLVFARQVPEASAKQHSGLLQALRAWRERRAAQAELYTLSDRELADIGISRQEIPGLVRAGRAQG